MNILYVIIFLWLNVVNSLRVISLKAGGLKGFYMLGVCKYLKETTNLENTYYYGASAGAWNALYLSQKTNDNKLINYLKSLDGYNFKNLFEIENEIKTFFLGNFNDDDFNLDKINICVSVLENFKLKKRIFNNFGTLEGALDCCMASSHIPYITSSAATYTYKGKSCIDGGIFGEPHEGLMIPELTISYDMWKNKEIEKYDLENLKISELIEIGYLDAYKNRKT